MTEAAMLAKANWWIRVPALALAYYVTGKLGLLLAIPPGYATAVWPAAGFALVGLLVLGYRAWPGVLLGSFLVNVGTGFDGSTTETIVRSVGIAAAIGAGAAAQAALGALLVVRFVGFPSLLDRDRDVGRLLAVGPLSCLVNSTIGVGTLVAAGGIQPGAWFFSWCTWYVGDAIGVLIFAPLLMVWASASGPAWRRRRLSVTAPLVALCLLVVLFFVEASRWEQHRIEREFEGRAGRLTRAVERTMADRLDVVMSLRDLFASSGNVERAEFRTYATAALSRHSGIHALSWNPRIPHAERPAYEAAARRAGHPDFAIKEVGPGGRLMPASPRRAYVAVFYAEPYDGNASALGYDLMSDSVRRETMRRAQDLDEPIATSRVRLVQDDRGPGGFVVLAPVYASGEPHLTVEQRRRSLRGYVAGVFRIGDLLAASLQGMDADGLTLNLSEEVGGGGVGKAAPDGDPKRPASQAGQGMVSLSRFQVAGRQWTVTVNPTPAYLAAQQSWTAWGFLAGGLCLTGLLGAFLLVTTGRATTVALLVEQRTGELVESNHALHRLASIVESSSDAIVGVSLDGTIVSWNAGAERMYGYPEREAVGRPVTLLHPGQSVGRMVEVAEAVAAGRPIGPLEIENLTKEGRPTRVSLAFAPITDPAGWLVGVATIARDVTEQRHAESELRATSETLRAIIDGSPLAIVTLRLDGTVLTWNPSAERLFGWTAEESLGQFLPPGVGGGHLGDFGRLRDQALASGKVPGLETRGRRKDGSDVDVSVSAAPLHDSAGVPVGIVAMYGDITERRFAEDALRRQRVFLEVLLDSLTDGVVACDAEGVLTLFNRATRELHGLPERPIPASEWADHYKLYHSDGKTPMSMEDIPLFRAWRGESLSEVEIVVAPRGRPPRTLTCNGRALVDPQGARLGAVIAMRDVTERRAVDRMKDEFIGTVSHELRTPLTAIRGFVELVADGEAGPVTAAQRAFLDIAARNADRLGALINDLLDVTRIESQNFELRAETVDLSATLGEVIATFRLAAERKGLTFVADLDPLPPIVGDRDRLIQLFGNLVSNAIKYTPAGEVGIRVRAEAGDARVDVFDSGIGLSAEEQERLFTKFFRGEGRVVAEAGGTGLGLVIVKGIVERHGGRIEVVSAPGQGTCFRVILPAASRAAQSAA